jgi:hypothetical protein
MSYIEDNSFNFAEMAKLKRIPTTIPKQDDLYTKNDKELPFIENAPPKDAFSTLLNEENWNYNKLSDLHLPYYKFRLFQVEDALIRYKQFSTYQELSTTVKRLKQVTIAETGVTGSCITHVDMTQVPAINPNSRSFATTKFSMTIREPAGTNFLDNLKNTAQYLGIRDFKQCGYFLSLTFHGYDEEGNIIHNPCKEFQNGGEWLYQIKILDIHMKTDSTGAEYNIDIIPWHEQILIDHSGMLSNPITITASTVGELFQKLGKQLTNDDEDMNGYNLKKYSFILPPFKMNDTPYNMSDWSITSIQEDQYNSKRNVSMSSKDGKITAHFPKGFAIKDIVDIVFSNSEDAQQLAKGIAGVSTTTAEKDKAKSSVVYSTNVVAETYGYDAITNNYQIDFIFTIKPFFTQRPILTATQIKESLSPTQQSNNMMVLRNAGYLCKRYDYLLTNQNTEVLALDIDFKFNWSALLPMALGYGNSIESNKSHDKYRKNTVDEIKILQTEMKNARTKIDELQELRREEDSLKNTKTNSTSEQETLDERIKANKAKQATYNEDALKKTMTDNSSKIKQQKVVVDDNERIQKKMISDLPDLEYSENISSDMIQNFMYPISTQQDTSDQGRFLNSGVFPDYYHRDRTLFGAVMDQLYYGTTGGSMQTIEMEIRGDPFWLGPAGLQKCWEDANDTGGRDLMATKVNTNMAEFSKGDTYLLLRMKYPAGLDDDGDLILNEDQSFTGVYHVNNVVSKFNDGNFTQSLTCIRMPLIQIFQTFGYVDSEQLKKQKEKAALEAATKRVGTEKGRGTTKQ